MFLKNARNASLREIAFCGALFISAWLFVITQLLAIVVFFCTWTLFEAATGTTIVGVIVVVPSAIAVIWLTCKNMRRFLDGLDRGDA